MAHRSAKAASETGVTDAATPSSAMLTALLDGLTLGVLLEDANHTVAYANQPLSRLFDQTTPNSLLGLPIGDALRCLFGNAADAEVAAAPGSQTLRLAGGRTLEVTRQPLPAGALASGFLWQFREVTSTPVIVAPAASPLPLVKVAAVILFALDASGTLTTIEGNLPGRPEKAALYLGRNVIDVVKDLGLKALVEPLQRALAGEEVVTTLEGRVTTVDIRLTPLRTADGAVDRVLGIVHDSSPRQQTERMLRRHNAYLETLHQTTLDLVNRLDLDHLLQGIVERAASLLGSEHGYIYLVEVETQRIVVRYGSGLFKRYLGFNMARGEGIAGKVWDSGEPWVVDEYDVWEGRSAAFDRDMIHSVVCVPLRIGGQIVGVIGVSVVDRPHSFSAEEVRLLSQFGELASLALENARLYRSAQDEIAERRRTEQALRESEERYRSVVTAMGEGIVLIDANGVITDVNATAERIFGRTRADLVGQRADVFGRHLIRPDGTVFLGSEYPAMVTLVTHQPQSDVLMGIQRDDGQLTWISVNSQPILGEDQRPAAVVASFSNITEHKQVQAELQRRIDMLAALQQVDVDLSKSLDIDYVLATALDLTMRATSADDGFIATIEDDQIRSLHTSPGYAAGAEAATRRWLENDLWLRLLAVRQPVMLESAPPAAGPALRVQIVLPLISQDRLIGLLALECDRERASQDNLTFLELVGARIATALDNARLFQVSQTQLAELQDVYIQVKRLEQLKTQMIRVAAHDLRSPLGVIGGYVMILRDDLGDAAEPYNAFFDAIFRALERMEQMTADILSLERIHATNEQTYERLSLAQLVARAYADHQDHAIIKNLAYENNAGDFDVAIRGDAVQLYEAIANLVSNAIKYTPEGGRVALRLAAEDDRAIFEVHDTGFGIAADAQAQLFQPFYRVKTDDTRTIDGTGLGLYLVKGSVERHEGNMRFSSAPGLGSVFGFDLPVAHADA